MKHTKLGRYFNVKTLMWEFADQSGVPIPDEKMKEIENFASLSRQGVKGAGLVALGIKWSYEDWYKKNQR